MYFSGKTAKCQSTYIDSMLLFALDKKGNKKTYIYLLIITKKKNQKDNQETNGVSYLKEWGVVFVFCFYISEAILKLFYIKSKGVKKVGTVRSPCSQYRKRTGGTCTSKIGIYVQTSIIYVT